MAIRLLLAFALAAALLVPLQAHAQTDSRPSASAAMAGLEQRLRNGAYPKTHAVIVQSQGHTLAEWYFSGEDERRGRPLGPVTFGPDTLHDVRSVSKSIVSLLFGIALSDGFIGSLDQPVLDFFPEYADLKTPERQNIRLRDLLSMTSGLHWDERTYPYTDQRNSETAMDRAEDRYRFILSQPIDAAPGMRFNYSGGDVALAAGIVARASKMPIEVYVRDRLFVPLGIERFEWIKDGKGIAIAASGLRLLPRDMAKIGQLVLQRGLWENKPIVAADWIAASTATHATVGDPRCGLRYGYLWWLGTLCANGQETQMIFASGNGGQSIWIAPERDLVVVTTIGFYNDPRGDQNSRAILREILGAMRTR